jgi:tetratricopeptide (TPR) repeat protein
MTTETARPADPADYPRGGTFADLLTWHMDWGTRPACSTTTRNRRWKNADITAAIYALSSSDPRYRDALENAEKTLGNWKKGIVPDKRSPERIDRLISALFGDDETLCHWKADLESALKNDREAKALTLARPKPNLARPSPTETPRVPFPTADFSGRNNEVEEISAGLVSRAQRAILIQGGPGIGKTELTKAVAHHESVVSHFGERCWFVPLGTATTAGAMRDAIIRAIGGAPANGLRLALDALGKDASLVVLDDLETLWEIANERQEVEAILAELARAPGMSLLASLRGRGRPKEPSWRSHFVEPLDVAASKQLLEQIVGPWVVNDPRIDDFAEALGGIPLAINLLTHRAVGRNLAPLWREWQERGVDILNLSDEPTGPLSSFSQSIMQSLASSRTTHDARRLFAMLGQLPSSILDEHVSAIFGADALDAVGSLLRVGLAVERTGRITLLPPVKDFASRKCALSEEDETLIREHYLGVMAKLGLEAGTPSDSGNVGRIEAELPNIEWAFLNALTDGKLNGVGDALQGLGRFSWISSKHINIFNVIDDPTYHYVIADFEWAYSNTVIGDVNLRNGNFKVAERAYHRAEMFMHSRFPFSSAEALIRYAEVKRRYGKYEDAKKHIGSARDIFEKLKEHENRPKEAYCFLVTARIHFEMKQYEEAFRDFLWATVYSENLDLFVKAQGIKGLGDVKLIEGDLDSGRGLLEEALDPFRQMGCKLWEARCIASLGRVDLREGKFDSAQSKIEDALSIFRHIDHGPGQADARRGLEDIALARAKQAETASTVG